MTIELISPPKELDDRYHKTYFLKKEVVKDIEDLKSQTNSKSFEELFLKMISVTQEELKKIKSKKKAR